jgi:hypothetical protein
MSDIDYTKKTLKELIQMEGNFRQDSEWGASARAELERRRFWKKFLTSGIVAWLALIVSIVALYISIVLRS